MHASLKSSNNVFIKVAEGTGVTDGIVVGDGVIAICVGDGGIGEDVDVSSGVVDGGSVLTSASPQDEMRTAEIITKQDDKVEARIRYLGRKSDLGIFYTQGLHTYMINITIAPTPVNIAKYFVNRPKHLVLT